MAATADSSGTRFSGDNLNGPDLRCGNLSSPWAEIVRGVPESISAVPSSSPSLSSPAPSVKEQSPVIPDCSAPKAAPLSPLPDNLAPAEASDSGNAAARSKKPAWNKPSNGVLDAGPVMSAASWPPLSESARGSPKLPAADSSSKPDPDGSVPTPQVPLNASRKQTTSREKSNSTQNNTMPAQQRSTKHGGGSGSLGGPVLGGFTHPHPPPPPPLPPFPIFNMPPNSYGGLVPAILDHSPREPSVRGHNWDARPVGGFVHQQKGITDRRNTTRRGNFGPHPRGDGPHRHNHGGRRDQDRGSHSNARDNQVNQQRPPLRGFVRPSPPFIAPFVAPEPITPLGTPLAFSEFIYYPTLPVEPYRNVPVIPPSVMYTPSHDPNLPALLVNQIDFYFSDDNLVRDVYLRSNMDDQGWVLISLIATFPRVMGLTNNVQLIAECLRASNVVEVQEDKVRRRNEWMKWMPLPKNQLGMDTSLLSPGRSTYNMLATSFQKITVEGTSSSQNMATGKGDPNSQVAPASTESAGKATPQRGVINFVTTET